MKATQQQTKIHNRRLILQLIYDRRQISRADLARITGLTRTTVSDLVAELLQEGLVEETGQAPSIGGKPPILLQIVKDSRCIIGIDLASHEFHGAVVNLRGEIKQRFNVPVYLPDGEQALERVYELIDGLLATCGMTPLGIGIGTPGLVNGQEGVVRRSVVLDWRDLPLGGILEQRYGLPVKIANDCQAAALAEMIFGPHQKLSNLILVKVGRGVGSGIVINNHLFAGDGSGAGEIGHMVVQDNGPLCRCGHKGCLEALVSSTAVLKRFRDEIQLYEGTDASSKISFDSFIHAYQQGDSRVKQVINDAAYYLGIALSNLVTAVNVEEIILAGSMMAFADIFIETAQYSINNRSLQALGEATSIKISSLGNDIVILGAAALLMQHELGIE